MFIDRLSSSKNLLVGSDLFLIVYHYKKIISRQQAMFTSKDGIDGK